MSIETVQGAMDVVTLAIGNLVDAIEDHYNMPDSTEVDPREWPAAVDAAIDLDTAKVAHFHRIIKAIGGA